MAVPLLLASFAIGLAAQNPPSTTPPPSPRHDSLARELILDEVVAVGPSAIPLRVTLTEGTVYRLEAQPGSADIVVRSVRQPSLPPLFLMPLVGGGPPGASQASAFLLVPRSTQEYRIDVTVTGTDPVRLRVWTDPREMSRYARMRQATAHLPMAGLSVRAAYYGAFVRPGPAQATASAFGVETCFGVVPRGAWASGPIGGCVLALGVYSRPDSAGKLLLIATEPRLELGAPGATLEKSLVLTIGLGTAFSVPRHTKMDYLALGLGLEAATRVVGLGRHWYIEAEAGVARFQQLGAGLEPTGRASLVPHLALGLQLRF
jgi:hypothetical protein